MTKLYAWTVLGMLAMGLGAAGGAAHPKDWVGYRDGPPHAVTGDPCADDAPGAGLVCFAGGHVAPDAAGQAVVTICCHHEVGFACQDLNANAVCGEADVGELGTFFCEATTLVSAAAWDDDAPLYVFIASPAVGALHVPGCPSGAVPGGFVEHE